MKKGYFVIPVVILVILALLVVGCTQSAQPVPKPTPAPAAPKTDLAAFYKGKTVTILSTSAAGSTADISARAFAPYFKDALGAANVVVKNETDAAGMVISNNFYNGTVKADGLSLLFTPSGALWSNWAYNSPGVQYTIDTFEYLGGDRTGHIIFCVPVNPPYNSIEGLQNSTKELRLTAMGVRSRPTVCSVITCAAFNLNAKIITGYPGTNERILAIQQGESEGDSIPAASAVRAAEANKVKMLFVVLPQRDIMYPDIPALTEVKKMTADEMKLFSVYEKRASNLVIAPPGTPKEIVAFLREKVAAVFVIKDYQDAVRKVNGAWATAYTAEELTQEALEFTKAKPTFIVLLESLMKKYIKE